MSNKRSQTSGEITCPEFAISPDTSNLICKRCALVQACTAGALAVMEGRAKSVLLEMFQTSNTIVDVFVNLTPEVLDHYENTLIQTIRDRVSKPGPEFRLKETSVIESIEKNFRAKGNEDPAFPLIFWARVKKNGNFNVQDGWLV